MKQIINSEKAPAPIGPYSQAVKHGNLLYVSGQIGFDEENQKMVDDSIESETKQVMTNIGYILTAAGLTFNNIIKCSIFVSDMNNFAQVNSIYGSFFDEDQPARETVEVSRLPKDVRVEISCIAFFND